MKKGWEQIGRVAVDTGTVVVVDPVNMHEVPSPIVIGDFVNFDNKYGVNFGVAVTTGWGDGHYPVYVERNIHGTIIALHIDFVPKGWDKDTE